MITARFATRPGHPSANRQAVEVSGDVRVGSDVRFVAGPTRSHIHAFPGAIVDIGDDVVVGFGVAISCQTRIEVGAGTRIGASSVLMDSDFHAVDDPDAPPRHGSIVIGRNVVVEPGVTILHSSTIGDAATITAGSVVSGHVPAGRRVSGNPAGTGPVVGGPATADSIASIVRDVFDLAELPSDGVDPMQITGWDSLGALRLLLETEHRLGVRLDESRFASARSIADMRLLVEQARRA